MYAAENITMIDIIHQDGAMEAMRLGVSKAMDADVHYLVDNAHITAQRFTFGFDIPSAECTCLNTPEDPTFLMCDVCKEAYASSPLTGDSYDGICDVCESKPSCPKAFTSYDLKHCG